MFKNNIIALHFYPELQLRDNTKPITNIGVGFLFAFKDKEKDAKSIVNAELYYDFFDVTKNTMTDSKLYNKDKIGLRLTLPINFINK